MEMALVLLVVFVSLFGAVMTHRLQFVLLVQTISLCTAGMALELLAWTGVTWTRPSIICVTMATQVSLAPIYLLNRTANRKGSSWSARITILSLAALPISVAVRYWISRPAMNTTQKGVFVDLAYFIGGEDNAKWLNTFSQLTQGGSVRVAGVGGVLVVVSTISWSLTRSLTFLFSSPWNEQSITLNALFVMGCGAVLLSPLAFLPFAESSLVKSRRYPIFVIGSAGLLYSFVASPRTLGHVTVQLVVLLMAIGLCSVVAESSTAFEVVLGWVVVSMSSSIWLGLRFFPVVVIGLAARWWIKQSTVVSPTKRQSVVGTALLLSPLPSVIQTATYLRRTPSTLTELFSATGGLVAVTTTTAILASIIVAVGIASLVKLASGQDRTVRTWLPFALLFYMLFISIDDLWETGKINYGTQKLWFIIVAVMISAFLIPCFTFVEHVLSEQLRGTVLLSIGILIALALVLDGVPSRAISDVNQAIWSGATSPVDQSYRSFVRTNTLMTQDLDQLPIGCVQFAQDGTMLTSSETYSCTRLLAAFAGLEEYSDSLNLWHLQQFRDPSLGPGEVWSKSRPLLAQLPSSIQNRILIVLDQDGHVKNQITIEELLSSYP